MKNLHFFDNLQEIVYVADVETYDIAYVNDLTMKFIGIDSLDKTRGEKCYKLFYGKDEPCEFCTNNKLTEGDFYEWKHKNELIGRNFLLRDTLVNVEGRKYRLEIGIDIDKIEGDSLYEIQNYKEHEKIINEGLAIALKEENVDRGIQKFLEYLGEKTSAERCYIFESKGETVDNTYEWCAEGVTHEKENLQDVPYEVVKLWYDAFNKSNNILIYHLEDIRKIDPEMYDVLKPQNIETLVVYPILIKERIMGFYGVDNVPLDIMRDVSAFLSIVSQFLSIFIQNRNLIKHLEQIGQYDTLTDLFNRPTAEEKINKFLISGAGAFIIFDLDKFKSVNDMFGHQKGDILLKEIALDVKSLCRKMDIVFRLGGDEFGIFYPTMTDKKIIAERCQQLIRIINRQVKVGKESVNIGCSLGIAVSDTDGKNFQTLYTSADMAMYRAKKSTDKKYCFFSDEEV